MHKPGRAGCRQVCRALPHRRLAAYNTRMKLAFLGTSEFAVPALQALVDAGHDVVAVYTRAPKPAGRGQKEQRTPAHRLADQLGLAVRTPRTLRTDETAADFKAWSRAKVASSGVAFRYPSAVPTSTPARSDR